MTVVYNTANKCPAIPLVNQATYMLCCYL